MLNFMKKIYILLFLIVSFTHIMAQNPGKITGKVFDAVSKQPIEYATISVFKTGNTSPFNGAVADSKGVFTISNIANGEYVIHVDFMGYKSYTADHLVINATTHTILLNTISLNPAQTQLNTVSITAKVPMVENKIDKLVYNAANDLTSQGGAALDILKKVPQVTVDIDG